MFEQQLTATGEYARLKAALQSPGAAALFGMQPAGRAVLYAALSAQEHTPLVVVTAGEADAVRMAADLETLGLGRGGVAHRPHLGGPGGGRGGAGGGGGGRPRFSRAGAGGGAPPPATLCCARWRARGASWNTAA